MFETLSEYIDCLYLFTGKSWILLLEDLHWWFNYRGPLLIDLGLQTFLQGGLGTPFRDRLCVLGGTGFQRYHHWDYSHIHSELLGILYGNEFCSKSFDGWLPNPHRSFYILDTTASLSGLNWSKGKSTKILIWKFVSSWPLGVTIRLKKRLMSLGYWLSWL